MGLSSDDRGVLTACPACVKTNRLSYDALDRALSRVCCPPPVRAATRPFEVPAVRAFDALIARSPGPVVVDFWAPWCGPCRMMAPEVERVAQTLAGKALVAKVDTEALPGL